MGENKATQLRLSKINTGGFVESTIDQTGDYVTGTSDGLNREVEIFYDTLTNPAGARSQLLGVYSKHWVRPVAEVLEKLGSDHVIVVHGHDGMDEISISGPTQVAELKDGKVSEYVIEPSQFGIEVSPLDSIRVKGAAESLKMIKSVLANEAGPARDIVVLNAGAALCVAGIAESIGDGVALADEVIVNGAAARKLAQLISVSQSFDPA